VASKWTDIPAQKRFGAAGRSTSRQFSTTHRAIVVIASTALAIDDALHHRIEEG
jgi:hypothetical protein